jgi:uncharacterized protein (DUF2126 family)/transglutaminase-like putative cysteine protease
LSPQVVRLRPAPHCRTPVPSYSLKITPAHHFINWQQDPYSNRLARLVFPNKTNEFSVEVDLVAEMTVINPFDFFVEKYAEQCPFEYDRILSRELSPYRKKRRAGPKLQALIDESRTETIRTNDYLVELNQRVQRIVRYLIRMEPGIQPPEKTLTLGSGSCRDSAWLLVQLLRHLGLAARFVSGYLIQLAPDLRSLDGPSGTDKDFTDLHAWTEVYLPGAGWIGLDPTSGLLAGEGHIPLACSADPVTAAAISGGFSLDHESIVTAEAEAQNVGRGRVKDEFEFSMSVTRIHEDPRVTKPYSDQQWIEIQSLGHQVDADLKVHDVRMTMGGEPTFVSVDDMDGAEWNTAAMGPMKYQRATTLIRRLRERFAPGGFLHHGMGKWYPGESLPRWALSLSWRKDGEPIWQNACLQADENTSGKLTSYDARVFILALAERLGVNPAHVWPGYEDAWYYLWKERRLPINVDPFESNLENSEDRARLARIFEQGLDDVVGYALPLKRDYYTDAESEWKSGAWFFRAERMYLVPGDSPMGLRLPLDSIPWVKKSEYPHLHEQDPMAVRQALPDRATMYRQQQYAADAPLGSPQELVEQTMEFGPAGARPRKRALLMELPPAPGQSASWIVRTALCAEVRSGILRVFMPPQKNLEDYLALVAAVEDTATAQAIAVIVEGYPPPHDTRIHTIKVTPDPGVIEVNTQPATSWDELVKNTTALYEEAHLSRLGTEKFMLDGRHTGTGGGNHILVGSACPGDSPLLRNPGLLRSLIGYWHNHPALSYLFSGLFVGPTSQAPRMDEARNDQVYELEIAFQQIPENNSCPPWTVDRIFRNLLIDAAGSTHRAEFSIDKLYSPESASGRLGLLEMRAFEMPPHARMSLT